MDSDTEIETEKKETEKKETEDDATIYKPRYTKNIYRVLKLDASGLVANIFTHKKKETYFVFAWIFAFISIIIYFLISNYNIEMNFKYLSLDISTSCVEVKQSLYGTYYGDINGYWSSEPKYNKDMSIYEISFEGSQLSTDEYTTLISDISNKYNILGNISTQRDLAWSLITWSTFNYNNDNYKVKFRNRANINNIFNLKTSVFVGNNKEKCYPYSEYYAQRNELSKILLKFSSKFNFVTSELEITVPLISVEGPPYYEQPCVNHFDIFSDFDYSPVNIAENSYITFIINMNTVAIAIAANFGIIDIRSQLNEIHIENTYGDNENLFGFYKLNLNEYGKFYVDPQYKNMNPIFCLNKKDNNSKYNSCFIYDGIQIYYPIITSVNGLTKISKMLKNIINFNNFNNNNTFLDPSYINTDVYDQDALPCHKQCNLNNDLVHCSGYDFNVGLVFYSKAKDNNYINTINFGTKMNKMMNENNEISVIDYFYDKLVSLSLGTLTEDLNVCDNCTIIGINFYDILKIKSINENTFELNNLGKKTNGIVVNSLDLFKLKDPESSYTRYYAENITFTQLNCVNTIYYPDAFKRFQETPPVKLINDYYQCSNPADNIIMKIIMNSYFTTLLVINFYFSMIVLIYYLYTVLCSYYCNLKKQTNDETIEKIVVV